MLPSPRLTPPLLGTAAVSVPLTPAPAALLPFGALGITPGARKDKNAGAARGCCRKAQRSRIAEKGDVWFVLTTQTDALRHVCIYGIHMLSWEIRGQQHKTRIRDANAKKTYMATRLCVCTCYCKGAYFWSIDRVIRFACHLLHMFTFSLLGKKCVHRQHPFSDRSTYSPW